MTVSAEEVRRTVEAIWRIESPRLIAGLARIVRDVGTAEEMAQDAMVAAIQQWPVEGVPENPGAWLMTIAKRRAIDQVRRDRMIERTHAGLGRERAEASAPDIGDQLDQAIWRGSEQEADDRDLLRLVFTACHPALSTEARVALTLRLLGGLTTSEIARAFLVSEPTIAQRIVRAKQTLRELQVPFEVPGPGELSERLGSVLEVIYLIFNEGYTATAGDDWMRPALCDDALRLGRMLAEIAPGEPESHGLVALMEIQASRSKARVDASGEPILLLEQNRALWDRLLVHRGLAALEKAEQLGGFRRRYTLQAAIAGCHARAATPEQTDWPRIATLYGELAGIMPSPIVELNRAVAVSMARGPQAGLELVDALRKEPALKDYHLLPAVRGDLLFKLRRFTEARVEFERAAEQTRNIRERDLLLERARACEAGSAPA